MSDNLPPGVTDADIDRAAEDDSYYEAWGECDCCSKQRWLSQVWAFGNMETWACEECRSPPQR